MSPGKRKEPASSRPKAAVIVNPASRSGLKVYRSLEGHIGGFFNHEVFFTEKRGHAAEIAKRVKARVIIVCGGDGTTNEIANGVAGRSDIAVAPTFGGSGCDLGRMYGIEKDIPKRLAEIHGKLKGNKGSKIRLSLVETKGNRRFFVGNGDAGFGADVAGIFDRYRRFGELGYAIGVIRAIMNIKPMDIDIKIDGKRLVDKALMIMFARNRFFAGGMKVSPNSDPFSDSARLIYLKHMSKPRFLYVFPSVYSGAHLKKKQIMEVEVRRLRIDTPGLPVEVEGEFVGHTPCAFWVTGKYIHIV